MPGSAPKYPYANEPESVAGARVSNFKAWWESLPQESRKNVRRSQKRGVEIGTLEFDDQLLAGIAGVNNESPMRQGKPNAHYGKTLDQVKKDHESFVERSEEHTSELQSPDHLVCRLLLEKKKKKIYNCW